jgi:hypothetical protein
MLSYVISLNAASGSCVAADLVDIRDLGFRWAATANASLRYIPLE